MRCVRRYGRAGRLVPGLAALLVSALAWLPQAARAATCADPAVVASVLRVLSDRFGLIGTLSLDNIRRSEDDPFVGGPACAADILGIATPPTMFGRTLEMVLYWEEPASAGDASVIRARLLPRRPPKAPPSLVDAAGPMR
jgi:hypothetical protein